MAILANALAQRHGAIAAKDIAFHLSDWREDAVCFLDLHLFPERFSADEIESGITDFLIHAPNHVAAAAKLAGYPIQDVFGLGPLVE